ncbi:MAG: pilin [Azoarcus sp.]|nr:pilin [Azoarcus sp.]
MGLAEAAKTGVTEFYADNNAWPTTNAEAGIDGNIVGNAVSSVTVGAGGQITIQYDAKVNSQTVLLIPADNGGSISWSCDTGTVDPKWRPARCR